MFWKHILCFVGSRCFLRWWIAPMISFMTGWENLFLKLLRLVVKGTFVKVESVMPWEKACSDICVEANNTFKDEGIELCPLLLRDRATVTTALKAWMGRRDSIGSRTATLPRLWLFSVDAWCYRKCGKCFIVCCLLCVILPGAEQWWCSVPVQEPRTVLCRRLSRAWWKKERGQKRTDETPGGSFGGWYHINHNVHPCVGITV